MTGEELREARLELGVSQTELGRALGYSGPNIHVHMSKLERGIQPIPLRVEPLVRAFLAGHPMEIPD